MREYRGVVSDNLRWRHFTHRPGDVFVCTPPKCGTTWTQTIVTALMFPDGAPGPVMYIAPWLDARFFPVDDVVGRLDAQAHRRQIKTHTPADGIPWFDDASYIVVNRDGRDACMSFLNHMRSIRPDVFAELAASAIAEGIDLGDGTRPPLDDEHAFFAWYLDDAMWFNHVNSFWKHRGKAKVLFVHFDDLKADLEGQMRRIAAFLDITIDEGDWPDLVESCTFAAMKQRADEIGDFDRLFVGGAESFLYKGTNGRWREVLTPDEVAAFELRSKELLPDDLREWVNRG
jgi:aryl sulfotransferase